MDRAVATARRGVAGDGRRRKVAAAVPRAPSGCASLLGLQRVAGNAAVGQLLGVQRATPAEFAIRGKFPGSASLPDRIFFDMNSAALDAAERAKIPALALPASRPLTLRGSASEEGPGAVNSAVVDGRIAAVISALRAEGWSGPPTPDPEPTAGTGNIDYRRARSVEVRPTGVASGEDDCSILPRGQPNDCGAAPNSFTDALDRADKMVEKAITDLSPVPLDPATTTLLDQLFGSASAVAAAAVSAELTLIKGQLANMAPFTATHGHRCVNNCDAGCGGGATAYNSNDNGTGAAAMMTLCKVFMSDPDLDSRAATLIHEGSHGTTGLETDDNAYQWQRLFAPSSITGRARLPTGKALKNADSLATFVRLINVPGSVQLGPTGAEADVHAGGLTGAPAEAVDLAVAWVQQWIVQSALEVSSLYGVMEDTIAAPATGPDPWTNGYYEDTMGLVAPRFGLTAPPAKPKAGDVAAVAGIHDRLNRLEVVADGTLELKRVASAGTSWEAGGGSHVRIGTGFFGLTPRGQADLLLRRLVASAPWIPAFRRATYISLVNAIVVHGGFGSP